MIHDQIHAGGATIFQSDWDLISFRQAQARDSEAILRLIRSERLNPLGNHWRNFLIAVNADGELIGCGQIKRHRDGSTELASIAVIPGWREQGVASAIIRGLMIQAGPPIWLTCRSGLSGYYARFGFETIDVPLMMPTYFRLARAYGKILALLWKGGQRLTIMRWSGEENALSHES